MPALLITGKAISLWSVGYKPLHLQSRSHMLIVGVMVADLVTLHAEASQILKLAQVINLLPRMAL